MPTPRKLRPAVVWAALLAGLLLFAIALRWPALVDAPLDRDEGAYAFIAQQWARGALPYRDYFDHKPPLVYLAYRLTFAVAGEHLAAVRVAFAGADALTALACAVVVWLLCDRRRFFPSVCTAVVACTFLSSPLVQGETANTEGLMLLGTAWSACFLLWGLSINGCAPRYAARSGRLLGVNGPTFAGKDSPIRSPRVGPVSSGAVSRGCLGEDRQSLWSGGGRVGLALAGLCAGLALLAKPVAVFESAFFLGWLALHGARPRRVGFALFGAGLVAPAVAWALYAVVHGALGASITATVLYNFTYVTTSPIPVWARVMAIPIDYGLPLALLWAGVAGCTMTALRSPPGPPNFALGWTLAAVLGIISGGRLYVHYYQQLVPPMAVALGVTLHAAWRRSSSRLVYGACIGAILLGLWPPLAAMRRSAQRTAAAPCAWQPRLAVLLRTATLPTDPVMVWGAEPYVYFAADRRPVGRFIYRYPLLRAWPAALAARQELRHAWAAHRPAVVVVLAREATAESRAESPERILSPGSPFHSLLDGFEPVFRTADFILYVPSGSRELPWLEQWQRTLPSGCPGS